MKKLFVLPMRGVLMFRKLVVSLGTGLAMLGVSWAGVGLAPTETSAQGPAGHLDRTTGAAGSSAPQSVTAAAAEGLFAGSASVSIQPDPDESAGERWQQENCATSFINENILEQRKTETPDCIYMGGRGLGPSEPVTSIDPSNPLAVRAVAVGDGAQTAVLVQVDGVYWFGR